MDIIDNIGVWGDKAGLSKDRKIEYLKQNNSFQISLALLSLFDAPQIKNKISELLYNLIKDKKHKDTIFSIALIELLDLKPSFSLVSEVAGNNDIYSSLLRHNDDFRQLFKLSDRQVQTKSSIFCLSLIKNHFLPSYVTDQLQKIAKHFNTNANIKKDFEQERIFKSTLKFSFVERLLPDTNKKGTLKKYYEDLKTSVPWLIRDPHFWLQYGMANITFKEYNKAQNFIDQAYALAAQRDNYHTSNIDTQQARLFILIAMSKSDGTEIYGLFEKAHRLLSGVENDIYKFRQVEKYKDFYETCSIKFSKVQKNLFFSACRSMIRDLEKGEKDGEIDGEKNTIRRTKNNLTNLIKYSE